MRIRSRRTILLAGLLLAACDRPAPPAAFRPAGQSPSVSLRTLVTLRPGGVDVLRATDAGLLVMQGGSPAVAKVCRADGTVLDLNERMVPLAAAKLGDGAARPAVQAMAAGAGGQLIVLLGGTTRTKSLASLWAYQPATDQVKLLISPDDLAQQSGLGDRIDLSAGRFVETGDALLIIYQGIDSIGYFRVDRRQFNGNAVRLTRAFSDITVDAAPLPLARGDRFFDGPHGTFGLFRPGSGEIWRVDLQGHATPDLPPAEWTSASAPPLELPDDWFGGAARLRVESTAAVANNSAAIVTEATVATHLPALTIERPKSRVVLDRDAISVYPGFPVYGLRLTHWCVDKKRGDVVAYDAMSGEVFGMTFSDVQ